MEQGPPIQDPLAAERIASALKKADAAGDVEGAKKLAAAYREVIAKTQQPVSAPVLPGKPPASPVTASPSTSVVGSGVGTPSGAGQTIQLAKPLPKLDRFGVPEINVVQQEASAIQQAAPQMLRDAATAARDAADYHRLYGGLNEAEAKAQREQAAAIARREIAGMKQGFDADHAQLEFAQTELDAKGRQVQELEQTDPIAAQQARQEFQQMAKDYNGMVGSLEKQQKAIMDLESGANRELEMGSIRERNIRATRGSKVGALYNELLLGTGDAVAGLETGMTLGLLSMVPEAAVPSVFGDALGTTKDQVLDRVRKDLMPALREAPYEMAASEGTTKEYSDKWREGFWGGSLLGLARSVPGMATPMMSGIGFQVLDGTMREMEDSPEFDDISASEKMAVALPLSAISMALEKFGFRNLASNKSVLKSIFRETLDLIPQDASVEQMQRIIDGNVKSAAGRYLMRMGTAGAAEFETGSTQEGLDSGLKELYNEARSRGVDDRGRFRTHDGWLGYAKEMIKAGAQESVGAIFLGQPYAISQALRKNKVGELASPQEFELVEESLKDPNYTREAEAHIDDQVAKGLITEVQADEVKSDWATARKVRDKIPDDLPTIIRREAFDILSQMEALKSKDPILVAGKMEALKERLRKLPGIESEPAKTGAEGEVKKPFTVEPTGEEVQRGSSLTTHPDATATTAKISWGHRVSLGTDRRGNLITQWEESDASQNPSAGKYKSENVEVEITKREDGYDVRVAPSIGGGKFLINKGASKDGLATAQEAEDHALRMIEAYDKQKLKSELTGTPMPEGSTRPKEITLEPVLQPTTEVVAPSAEEVPAIESAPAEVEPGFYRETSVSDAIDLIPTGRRITELGDIHLADSPDMALGQGNNKGVLLEFDQSGITVKENTSKPGLGIVEGGGREFISRGQRQSAFKNALRRITVNNNARADVVGREVLNRSLKELEAQGWVKEKTADGTTWTKPPATGVVNKSQTDSDNATTETPTLTHVPDGPSRLSDIDIAKNSEDAFAAVVAPKPRDKKQALRDLKAFLMETFGWKDVRIGIDGHGSFDFTVDGVDFKVPGGGATIGGSNTFLEADLVEIINAKHDAHEGESQPPVITEQSNAQTPTPTPVPESAITEPTTPSGEVLAAGVVEDAAIEQLRAHASSSKNERRIVTRVSDGATVIDVQGGKAEDGLSDSVEFTTDKDANAWLESGDIIDSHTHPDESSFSDGDWGTFAWSHVKEMRVVTQSGTVFTLKKTPKWDAIPWEERTPRKIRDRWNELSNRDLTTKSVSENIHDINEEMAEEFGIEFSSSISLPGVEPTTEPLTIFKGVKGKIGPNGERISAHEGVEGVFGSLDQSVSEKYKGDEPLKRFDIPSGTTVGTVEVDVKGKSVDEYRAEEVKAINASPAQVVKLITLDSGKGTKQEQYIIKDKGLIDSATDVVDVPPPTEPPVTPPTEKPEPTEPERLMRAQAKRIKNEDPELFKALNLDDNTVYYDRFPNVVSEAAAQELIGYLGNSKAEAHITDPRKKIPGAVRAQMYKALKKQYYKEKDYDAAKRLIDAFAPLTTEAGQFTQALYDKEDFAEGRAVMQAIDKIAQQRDLKQQKDKQHPKIKKGLREVNKQVVEEVISSRKIADKSVKAAAPDQGSEPKNKPHFGTKNKLFTKERKDAAWKAMMSRTAGAIIQPEMVVIAGYYLEGGARSFAEVAEKVVKRGGKKLLPYLKGAYEQAANELGIEPSTGAEIDEYIAKSNTDKIVARLNKAIEKKDKKAQAKAIAELQQVAKDTGLWGTYKKEAVDRLRRLGDQAIKEDVAENPPLADFTNGLLKNLTAQMREEAEAQGKEEPEPKKRRKDIEVIGDAFKNFEKYEDVWKQTQNEFKGRLRAAEARLAKAETPAAKEEASKAVEREEARLASLDAYFGELMPKPFSEAGLGRAVKEGMKDLGQKIDNIIRQHYTKYDDARRSLQDKLVQEAGLNETQAKELSDAVGKEFDRLATDRKQKVIEKYASKKVVKERKSKNIEDDLITLTNTGAFSDDQFILKYGEMMGWPSLTKENIKKIEELAERIQTTPEGRPREDAIADLLGYQANLAGVSMWDLVQSIWYANMLSGFQTQEVNALANVAQVASELFIGEIRAATRVKGGKGRRAEMAALLNAVGYGLKRGANEAGSTLRTGYSPIRGKVEIPPTLERIAFKGGKLNPGNYAKYVRRVMVAADVLFFEAARELRAEQLAQLQARSSDPSDGKRQEALDIMNKGDDAIRNAKDQAHEEYQKEVEDIKKKGLTEKEEKNALRKAEVDEKRRVFELVEKNRPANIKEDAAKFAARVTYNYKPEGFLGAAAGRINGFLDDVPAFRYIIPFVNIIANVANETLNYSPVGYLRAASGGPLNDTAREWMGKDRRDDHFTEEQKKQYKADLIAKASVGMALMAAAMVLSDPGDDDDPVMEITANGFGDWKKNRALEETKGWQQYSIKIGDKWISYQYTPVATVLSMIGHYRDAQKYRAERIDDDELANLSVAAWRSGSTFMDATMLGTLKDVLGAARGEEEGWRGQLAMSATRIAKGMVVPALYTQAARAVEAANESPMKDVRENPLGYLSQDIPVVRDAQFNRLNWLGEPVIPEGGVLPRFVSVEKSEPAAELIGHYGWNPSIPSFKKVYDPDAEKDRVTTKQEQYDFMRIRGQYLKNEITTRFDELMGLEKAEFLEEMKLIQSDATYEAKSELGLD